MIVFCKVDFVNWYIWEHTRSSVEEQYYPLLMKYVTVDAILRELSVQNLGEIINDIFYNVEKHIVQKYNLNINVLLNSPSNFLCEIVDQVHFNKEENIHTDLQNFYPILYHSLQNENESKSVVWSPKMCDFILIYEEMQEVLIETVKKIQLENENLLITALLLILANVFRDAILYFDEFCRKNLLFLVFEKEKVGYTNNHSFGVSLLMNNSPLRSCIKRLGNLNKSATEFVFKYLKVNFVFTPLALVYKSQVNSGLSFYIPFDFAKDSCLSYEEMLYLLFPCKTLHAPFIEKIKNCNSTIDFQVPYITFWSKKIPKVPMKHIVCEAFNKEEVIAHYEQEFAIVYRLTYQRPSEELHSFYRDLLRGLQILKKKLLEDYTKEEVENFLRKYLPIG